MKNFLYGVILLFIVLFFCSLFNVFEKAEKNLYCNKDGNFTILVVSDPQCDTEEQWYEARDELEILIKRSNPDFVLINGDMNSDNKIPSDMWDIFIKPVTSREIYWSTTNGNHDFFTFKNYKMYKKYDNCLNSLVSKGDINYDYQRPMNYVIPIYSYNGEKIIFVIYGMDTGTSNKYGYEGLTKKQINWYKQQSNRLKSINNNKKVVSLICMHIPVTQTLDMFYSSGGGNSKAKTSGGKYNIYGVTNQNGTAVKNYTCTDGTFVKESYLHVTAPQNDRGFFDEILKQGDVKAIIFGHEHNTNIVGSYKGVLLGFAGKLSTGCYSDEYCRGGRVIKINENNPEKFTTSWIGSMESSKDQAEIFSDGTIKN